VAGDYAVYYSSINSCSTPITRRNCIPQHSMIFVNNGANIVCYEYDQDSVFSFVKSVPVPGTVHTNIELKIQLRTEVGKKKITKYYDQVFGLIIKGSLISIYDGPAADVKDKKPLAELWLSPKEGNGCLNGIWQHDANKFEFVLLDRVCFIIRSEPSYKILRVEW
jgi:hypothetical protein